MLHDEYGVDLSKVTWVLSGDEHVAEWQRPANVVPIPEGKKIDESDIEKYVGISKEYNVFELQNAIGQMDIVKVMRIVKYFTANPKAAPIQNARQTQNGDLAIAGFFQPQ